MRESRHKKDRRLAREYCRDADSLHAWITHYLHLHVPRTAVCAGHDAPFEYLKLAYFEPARDLVVWAPRGGGKTRLAAVATLLDLLHKPPAAVRLLGGSLLQSLRMWEHLVPDLERVAPKLLARATGRSRRIELPTGSSAAVLTQSACAVRGLRVQKLRCDEVELFDHRIWEAAQLTTRSMRCSQLGCLLATRRKQRELTPQECSLIQDKGNPLVNGTIEALSTFHTPGGLMSRIIERAEQTGTRVLRWCILEVLERCPAERDCAACPLWDDCRGLAKTNCDGFFRIDDAIEMKRRVSRETWEAEMLCRRPSVQGCVFPSFEESIHVRECSMDAMDTITLAIDFGFNDPFVCLWIADDGQTCRVIDEYVQRGRIMSEHIHEMKSRNPLTRRVSCDPSGGSPNQQTAESNVKLLQKAGYQVNRRHSRIVEGIELIRASLRSGTGESRLLIHPKCRNLIRAMQRYRYPAGGGELPLKDGEHDHLIDALRYHYVNRSTHAIAVCRY